MKNILFILLTLFTAQFSLAQEKEPETLSDLLEMYNERSVPYISVQELAMPKTNAIILDAREIKEYTVSHIKNTIYVGYDDFQIDSVQKKLPNKDTQIVVYCSLGIRSEDIAEKIKKAGYTNVFNLYGGIFEWKNNGFKVYDSINTVTENVHIFSKEWSKWLTKGEKVYE
ncbi:rhodanese-like domain-containing protein [Flavobacteriaceae bacterium PRS1]|jgi:rhodanese-related sulfurtransferase|nr:rhodanese-like domain-containing protein [Flavobacteriaceae bacterium PRS1]